mgnify:CR=1 FL=1
MKASLGFIEVVGLLSAVTIADTMLKVANVSLNRIEKAKGGGWMIVSVSGDVAAVKASIQAGEQMAKQMSTFISSKIIPRPVDEVWRIFGPNQVEIDTVADSEKEPYSSKCENVTEGKKNISMDAKLANEKQEINSDLMENEELDVNEIKHRTLDRVTRVSNRQTENTDKKEITCNLCNDHLCPRRKGEPRKLCIHHNEMEKNEK